MDRELLERQLTQLPIVEYLFFETEELTVKNGANCVCALLQYTVKIPNMG